MISQKQKTWLQLVNIVFDVILIVLLASSLSGCDDYDPTDQGGHKPVRGQANQVLFHNQNQEMEHN